MFGYEPHLIMAEDADALVRGDLSLLGVAHRTCVVLARQRLHSVQVPLAPSLPLLTWEDIDDLPEPLHLPPSGRACAFCGRGGKLTDEHVWQQWISRALRQLAGVAESERPFVMLGQYERRVREIDVMAPICGDCNTRWLAALEQDAQRLLAPPVTGNNATLGRKEQALTATWAVKTALMLDLSRGSEAIIPLGFYRDFAQRRTPLSGMYVWIAGYAGPSPAGGARKPLWVDIDRSEPPNAFVITLSAGGLILQVAGHFVMSGSFYHDGWPSGPRPIRQIWPLILDSVSWPPEGIVLSHEALVTFASSFSDHAADESEPQP